MNIFIIPTSYPNKYNPIANIFIYEQAKSLAKYGHKITVLNVIKLPSKFIFKKINKQIEVYDDKFSTRYTILMKTFMESKFPRLHAKLFNYKVKKLYYKIIKNQNKPDIFYAHFSLYAGYTASLLSKRENIPIVTLEHNSYLMNSKIKNIKRIYLERTINNSDAFICVSNGLKMAIESQIKVKKKIYVVPNMIEECFKYHPHPKNNADYFVFSSIGNLNHRKRFLLLVEAFCEAFNREDKVILRIGGDGEQRNEINKVIYDNNRENQILLLGSISREESLDEYINCNCFVLPSSSESFGLVYREAMAVGRPIITTNHGGFDNDWSDKYGIMINIDNKMELINALINIKNNINKYDGKLISKECLFRCSSENIIKQISELMKNVISKDKEEDLRID